jgi:hypothetical protein
VASAEYVRANFYYRPATIGKKSKVWACDNCLSQKRAILANLNKQNLQGCHPNPYLAYYDKVLKCKQCNEKFVFSKEEQQYWFETLKFNWGSANACAPCRKKKRFLTIRTTKLSKLLPIFETGDHSELENIVALYLELGKPEAAKRFLAKAAKRCLQDEKTSNRIQKLRASLKKLRPEE